MNCFAQSDRGTVRKENQDRAACAHIRRKGCTVAVVCDGMGGAAGGKLASDLAASTFLADFRREMMAGSAVEPAMRHACDAANRAVYDRACAEPDLRGMGTTIVAACVRRGRLTVLHVGDSRAYLVGLRRMQQLTTDHSLVQELVASGQVLPEQAHRHPRRNVITPSASARRSSRTAARCRFRWVRGCCCARMGCPTRCRRARCMIFAAARGMQSRSAAT